MLHPTNSCRNPMEIWIEHTKGLFPQIIETVLSYGHASQLAQLQSDLVSFSVPLREDFIGRFKTSIDPQQLASRLFQTFWSSEEFWYIESDTDLVQSAQLAHTRLEGRLKALRQFTFSSSTEIRESSGGDLEEEQMMQVTVRGLVALYGCWRNILLQSPPPPAAKWLLRKGLPREASGSGKCSLVRSHVCRIGRKADIWHCTCWLAYFFPECKVMGLGMKMIRAKSEGVRCRYFSKRSFLSHSLLEGCDKCN